MINRNVAACLLVLSGLCAAEPARASDEPNPSHRSIGASAAASDDDLAKRLQASQDLLEVRGLAQKMLERPEQFNLTGNERFLKLLKDGKIQELLKDKELAGQFQQALKDNKDALRQLADTVEKHPDSFTLTAEERDQLKSLAAKVQKGMSKEDQERWQRLLHKVGENPQVTDHTFDALKRLMAAAAPANDQHGGQHSHKLFPPITQRPTESGSPTETDANADKPAQTAVNGPVSEVLSQLADSLLESMPNDQIAESLAALLRRTANGDGREEAYAKAVLEKGSDWLSEARASAWLPPAEKMRSLYSWLGNLERPTLAGPATTRRSGEFLPNSSRIFADGRVRALLGFLAVAVFGVAAWRMALHYRAALVVNRGIPDRWPVSPDRVATRGDLVQAFEYLALLCLGVEAKNRHHLDLAQRLGGLAEPRREAARQLAHLYELARYAPVDDKLPETDLAAARRDLTFLAGAGAA